MKNIIPPVSRDVLVKELSSDKFVRKTNNGGNELYIFTANECPNLMLEIGRLREEAFRHAGGGTGEETDIDHFDSGEGCYSQLIVWDPDALQILGGYRFKICDENTVDPKGEVQLSTAELFRFSPHFVKEYLPHVIELGRSFVQPLYQSTGKIRKGIYALDNLWDGLGAIIVKNPEKKYFFGKVTMYNSYNVDARNHLLFFLERYFADTEDLITPIYPMETQMNREVLGHIFSGKDYDEDYKILRKSIRNLGEIIPPLINSYMDLSPTMKVFGTAINPHFGGVEETAIMARVIFPPRSGTIRKI
ncbi:MAG TPA: GNAT family N-acetyltransferase [Bacteroidales bacterium]|nr:GNAT family N-acetyltransferase [Bacteroidales bacterium]